jgi:urease accessory protein
VTSVASGWTDTEASIRLRRGAGGTVRVDGTLCTAPLWIRWDGVTLWLVGSGASPAGEDHVRVCVNVGPDVAVNVRSVAATVVYAARGAGTRWETELRAADGATVVWQPEPVIVTGRARHDATTTVRASATATVTLDEVLVLGRAGEAPGWLRSTLDVRVDDTPTLLTSLDTSVAGWSGPAGTNGATVVANRLRLGGGYTAGAASSVGSAALLAPAAGCRLAVAAASSVAEARRSLGVILPVCPFT